MIAGGGSCIYHVVIPSAVERAVLGISVAYIRNGKEHLHTIQASNMYIVFGSLFVYLFDMN